MSANLESMFSASRVVPWHGLGEIVNEALNSADALRMAGLDWTVRQEQVVYKDQESGYFMNIRSNDDKVLGVVGGRYKPVQNVDAFDFTDALLGEGVTYETAGSLASGKRIWLLAKMPEKTILGDVVEPYLCLTNSHDGFGSLKVAMTPVRVVCQNTLNVAINSAKRLWTVRHTSSIDSKLAEARHTLGLATQYMEKLDNVAEELFKVKIAPKQFNQLLDGLFPITGDMSARKEEAQMQLQEKLIEAWNMDDLDDHRGTGWGFINAVSDMTTHKRPSRITDNYRENAFMATIDAPVILDKAFKLVQAL